MEIFLAVYNLELMKMCPEHQLNSRCQSLAICPWFSQVEATEKAFIVRNVVWARLQMTQIYEQPLAQISHL